MAKRILSRLAVVAILLVTAALFVRYFTQHPEYWHKLGQVSPWVVVWVVLLNIIMLGVLVVLSDFTIRMTGKRIGPKENFILTSYSTLANFFGPLQSGPGVRAVYLKSKYKVRIRDYTLATLIGLGLFALYNALFLLVGTRPWWQTMFAVGGVGGFSYGVIHFFISRDKEPDDSHFRITGKLLAGIMAGTFVQAALMVIWYYIELHAVNPGIEFSQAISYTGAANFSLYVSITPAATGIREAFLVFSQGLHHVSTGDIAAANLIDRASYLIFLGLLFLVVLSTHAGSKLRAVKSRGSTEAKAEKP